MLKFGAFRRDSKASVAVEFAMISTFFLFPLFSGVADCVEIISAQAQLNTAVQALYYDAWNNPNLAATTTASSSSPATNTAEMQTVLNAISPGVMTNMTLGTVAGTVSYECYTPGIAPTPSTSSVVAASGDCPPNATTAKAETQQQTWVTYQVNATVNLTFPFPGLSSSVPLTAMGKVEVQ
jgi:hypothetical protein